MKFQKKRPLGHLFSHKIKRSQYVFNRTNFSLYKRMHSLRIICLFIAVIILTLLSAGDSEVARADWVGTAVNRIYLDPESVLGDIADGYDQYDEVSFMLETTPSDTGSTVGAAAWMLVYMPDGVEIVGAELVSPDGDGTFSAIPAEDVSPMSNECGPRGCRFPVAADSPGTGNSRLNEIQQDTGVFYSSDPRTALLPAGIGPIQPSGVKDENAAGKPLIPQTVYNQWDYDQVVAFGRDKKDGPGPLMNKNKNGEGHTPLVHIDGSGTWYGTGSPVAGSGAYFTNDYNPTASCTGSYNAHTFVQDLECVGPWNRIKYDGAKIGGVGAITESILGGKTPLINTAVPTTAGWDFSTDGALPLDTNAVRFVQGERRLGDLEYGRITFRITDLAAFTQSIFTDKDFCLDATGGDTDKQDGPPARGAQDNPWRYYESNNHTCYEGSDDAVLIKQPEYVNGVANPAVALSIGDIIGYKITFTNISTGTLHDIVLSEDLTAISPGPANLDLVNFSDPNCPYNNYNGDQGGNPTIAAPPSADTATWNELPTLAVGESVTVHMCGEVTSSGAGDEVRNLALVEFATVDGGSTTTLTSETLGTVATLIAGTVYADNDASGGTAPTTGDVGIQGVSVSLYSDDNNSGTLDAGDTLLSTHITNASGYYQFTSYPAGDYLVVETNLSDYTSTGDKDTAANCSATSNATTDCDVIGVTLPVGGSSVENDFFDKKPYTIGDTIYRDWNGDGDQDASEDGISDVVVSLTPPTGIDLGNGAGVAITTTTNTSGFYEFPGLRDNNTYTVTVESGVPSTYNLTGDPDGSSLSEIFAVTIASADVDTVDFGYQPTGVLNKEVSAATAAPGDTLVYTMTTDFDGTNLLTNAVITDTVPPGTTYVADSDTPEAAVDPADDSTATFLTWSLGSNAAGSTVALAEIPGGAGHAYADDFAGPEWKLEATGGASPTDKNGSTGDTSWTGHFWQAQVVENGGGDSKVKIKDSKAEIKAKAGNVGDYAAFWRVVPLADQSTATIQITTGEGVKENGAGDSVVLEARLSNSDPWTLIHAFSAGETALPANTELSAILGALTDTTEIRFKATSGGAGEAKIKLLSITVNGTELGDPATTTTLTAERALLSSPGSFNVRMTVDADVSTAVTITPGDITAITNNFAGGTLGANCNGAPTTVVDNQASTGDPAEFIYTCTVTDAPTDFASVHFRANPTGSGLRLPTGTSATCSGVTETDQTDTACSNSVLVIPPLVFSVTVDDPVLVSQIDNQAYLSDDNSIPTIPSNIVTTDIPEGVIGNYVWLDENGDGVQDAGESGIPNVVVQLTPPAGVDLGNGVGNAITTTTDANGGYLFVDILPNSGYTVSVDTSSMPAGLAANPTYDEDGGIANQTTVNLSPGEEHLTADFGYNWVSPTDSSNPPSSATGAIGDRVWNDANGDGVQDPGESGIAGVTVSLLTDDNGDGVYGGTGDNAATTTTTDAAGNYIFDGLAPSSYMVQVTSPVGYTQTGDPDQPGATCSTCDAQTTSPIVLAPGDVYVNADFGYDLDSGSNTIGNQIFVDANGDGDYDSGSEDGIPGVTVALLDSSGNVIATTITDGNGQYSFPGLPNGDYTVWVNDTNNVLGELVQNSTPNNGSDNGQPCGTCNNQNTVTVFGSGNSFQDFGYAPVDHDSGEGFIGDTIFLDTGDGAGGAANGSPDAGEGVEGVTVNLYDTSGGTLLATTVTDENGNYYFAGLNPTGTYNVAVDTSTLPNGGVGLTNSIDPDGNTANESDVDLSSSGPVDLDQDFGYTVGTPNTVGGTVWNDSDAEGDLDESGNGISGVTVVLHDSNGNIVATTVTDGNGDYSFPGLPDGTYTVDVTDDDDVLDGYWHSDGPNDNDDNNSQDDPYSVTVTSGSTNTTGDFGYYRQPAALSNFIWDDLDGDGIQNDGAGTEIPNVDVLLTITYPNGDIVTVTTTTDVNGLYDFGNLLLDENYNGDGAGTEPSYEISIAPNQLALAGYGSATVGASGSTNDNDSNDHTGATAQPVQGTVDDTYDFGYIRALSVGGTLWFDDVINNVLDGGDSLLGGLTVELYASDGTTLLATTTTDSDGNYIFNGLDAGDYIVEVPSSGQPRSIAGSTDPDDNQDNDDNGAPSGSGAVRSQPVTLEALSGGNGSEPTSGADGDNDRSNRTVDFGFTADPTAVSMQSIQSIDIPVLPYLVVVLVTLLLMGTGAVIAQRKHNRA